MSTTSISQEKLEANRRNAQNSTGPKTPEGKARSSRNALKHGLLAKCIVLREDDPHENALDFEQLLESLAADLRPEGASEQILVEQLATCYWRLRRAYRFEANDIDRLRDLTEIPSSAARLQSPDFRNDSARIVFPSPDNLQRLVRYETMIERQLHRTLKHLNCLQRARRVVLDTARIT